MEDRLDRIVESLRRIDVNLEGLRVSVAALVELCADHEQRLRSIERWKQNLTPVLAALTFALGGVVSEMISRLM